MNFDLTTMTREQLDNLAMEIEKERNKRKEEKREELISAFRKAFDDLHKNSIDVLMFDEIIDCFEQFDFY